MITNPILPGFNPDPSICRVGEDYYIATSTFEWYPGVRIYHSKDLANWTLVATPLNRASLLDMTGVPDSCGVWAPCLSYSDGKFWLAYTIVTRFDGNFKDTHNYITTCDTVDGVWDDPTYVNSSGFDPSLYHDTDGRKYWLNMVWDHRPDRSFFRGVICQEFDAATRSLIGPKKIIFDGTEADCTEAPHIYRDNGYYYLMTAEGGTGYEHQVTVARATDIWGPYEEDPNGAVITARDNPSLPLQRTGHASLVKTHTGKHYLTYLVSRPIEGTKRSPMGRESAIQEVAFTDDHWLRPVTGTCEPVLTLPALESDIEAAPNTPVFDDFDAPALDPEYQWLRTPDTSGLFTLSERAGHLRLFGRNSLGSLYDQALVAHRQTSLHFIAETCVDFAPETFQQTAGLVYYYNAHKYHYLYVGFEEGLGRYIGIMSCEADQTMASTFPIWDDKIAIPSEAPIHLKATVNGAALIFSWSVDGETWTAIDHALDASLICDETGKGDGANFTGAFIGMCAQDLTGERKVADFDYFRYENITT